MKRYKDTPYFVTKDGKVFRDGKLIKTQFQKKGGYEYKVMKINNIRTSVYIHRMIAETYIPNPENKPEVNHWDGNTKNNIISNLFWATSSENKIHKTRILKRGIKENHNMVKLTEDDVQWIRNYYIPNDRKFGMNALAKKFNITPSNIHKIIHNKTWILP
jgi:hypothetical protein